MKIIQANIWHGKLNSKITDFFRAEKPDFICLQEICDLKGSSGTGRFVTLDEIVESTGLNHVYMSPAYSFSFMKRELGYGNAILSKHPITNSKTVFTNKAYKKDFDTMQDGRNFRNFQQVQVDVEGAPLHLLNHHGYHVKSGVYHGNDATTAGVKMIADAIKELDGPLIVCGDFNLDPDSPSLAPLNEQLHNLTTAHHVQRTTTSLCPYDAVLDYIFINDQIREGSFAVSDVLISDHKPLVFEFSL